MADIKTLDIKKQYKKSDYLNHIVDVYNTDLTTVNKKTAK